MELGLAGKAALVTGGSRGIGRAICLELAAEGMSVGVNCVRNRDAAEKVVAEIAQKGGKACVVQGDVASEKEVISAYETLEKNYGIVEVLVNNAAVCPSGPITSYSREDWEKTFSVNVTGLVLAAREFVARLTKAGRKGSLVNIASQAAFLGSTTGHLPYDASKGAVVSFTRALARETAPQGIRVNAIAAGMVMTEMVAETWEKRKDKYLARIPLGRIAETEEISRVVAFLASDASSYMTGATVDVSGGLLMH
jgi:3-oxoacyl-[acyl-carrier protein] reductase